MRAHSMRNNQILHGDQTENFAGSITMLTRDLFAVANLVVAVSASEK